MVFRFMRLVQAAYHCVPRLRTAMRKLQQVFRQQVQTVVYLIEHNYQHCLSALCQYCMAVPLYCHMVAVL